MTCAWIVVVASGVSHAQNGKLQDVRDAVRRDDSSHDASATPHATDENDFFGELFGELFKIVLSWPIVIPRRAVGDDELGSAGFLDYPEQGGTGFWARTGTEDSGPNWSFRPRLEIGTDFDGLGRVGLALNVEHASRFGLDATWSRFSEDRPQRSADQLDLGDVNVVFRFAQSPRSAWRAGIGANYLFDVAGSDFGLNLTYGADFLPAQDVTLGLEGDLGGLGNATLLHGRVSAGVLIRRFELFASWDGWDLDHNHLSSFGLGLRCWL